MNIIGSAVIRGEREGGGGDAHVIPGNVCVQYDEVGQGPFHSTFTSPSASPNDDAIT